MARYEKIKWLKDLITGKVMVDDKATITIAIWYIDNDLY